MDAQRKRYDLVYRRAGIILSVVRKLKESIDRHKECNDSNHKWAEDMVARHNRLLALYHEQIGIAQKNTDGLQRQLAVVRRNEMPDHEWSLTGDYSIEEKDVAPKTNTTVTQPVALNA
ncbi:hypothetical protein SLS58_003823 [Diplodia intermedia]|uniref:Uncharacterized protein n=1 Tax=Diplodia intermedia TaxID=856260 RepID=A0ABR3TW52_9PEZI